MAITCEEIADLSASYALGALEGEEKSIVEEHLERCPACRMVLEQDREIVGRLPEAVKVSDPPSALKGRLFARVDAYEAEAKEETAAAADGGKGSGRSWLSLFRNRPYVFGTAMAALVALLLGWSISQTVRVNRISGQDSRTFERLRELEAMNSAVSSRVQELEAMNEKVSTNVNTVKEENVQLASVVRRQWDALAFATAPEIKAVRFDGTDGSPTVKASLFLDDSTLRAMMMITGLKPPVEGYTYQMWLVTSEKKVVSLGTFRTIADGYAAWAFQMPYSAAPYYTYIVSMEPRGGSDWPTTPPVLRSKTT